MRRAPFALRLRRCLAGALVLAAWFRLGDLAPLQPRAAHASAAATAGISCALGGKTYLMSGTTLHRDAKSSAVLAVVSGGERGIEVDDLPDDTSTGRAHFSKLTQPTPGLRLTGWISADLLPLATSRELQLFGDHLRFAKGRPIVAKKQATGSYAITLKYGTFVDVHVDGGCADLQLGTLTGPTHSNKSPRMIVARAFDLYDTPGGTSLRLTRRTLEPLEVDDWGGAGAFRHIHYVADEILDGYVRASELRPVTPEVGDAFGVGGLGLSGIGTRSGGPSTPPRELTTTREIEVRDAEGGAGLLVGTLEIGARIRLFPGREGVRIELVDESFRAPAGGGFWVRSSDLGM